ncbi:ABC transporter permease [Desulfovibrio sp. OttesenSCG-928-F07]|nr:ABC transporter permease [Desulfovibrio sp. OttesenSCG-928-F07]
MFAFIIRRIGQAILVMLVISFIGFAIKHTVGDPIRDLVGISVSVAEREALRTELGLNDPFLVQWGRFLKGAVQGDLGPSFIFKKPAMEVIIDRFPATMELVLVSSILIILVSIPVGVYAAYRPNSLFTRMSMGVSTLGVSVPVFLTAILLIYIFSVYLGWLPSYGRGPLSPFLGVGWQSGLTSWEGFTHLILPSISLSSIMLPLFIRLIRAEMRETLETEYVKFARAKGLSEFRVVMVHAFKNTLLPVITVGGVQLGTMIAFTVLTESVFNWPGMGTLFIQAIDRADTSLLVAYIITVGALFVTVNTIVDIIYGFINPMVRITGRK